MKTFITSFLGVFLLAQSNCYLKGTTQTLAGTKEISLSAGCFQLHYSSNTNIFRSKNKIETSLTQGSLVAPLGTSLTAKAFDVTDFDSARFTADQLKKLGFQVGDASFTMDVTDQDTEELLLKVVIPAHITDAPLGTSDC